MSDHQLHVYFIPMVAPGHMIPTIDIARKFSRHGAKVTIITTSSNASPFSQTIQRDRQNGSDINVSLVNFPCREAGLPDGCENLSATTTPQMFFNFLKAIDLLQQPVEEILLQGKPDCIVSGVFFTWTADIALRLGIPRIAFHATGFFPMSVFHAVRVHRPHQKVASDSEQFLIPSLPDEVRMSRLQLPEHLRQQDNSDHPLVALSRKVLAADEASHGMIVNSFLELEPAYAAYYRKFISKAWHIGPTSLINDTDEEKSHRGRETSTTQNLDCLNWLNSKKPSSVIYISFGSMAIIPKAQLQDIANALESSGQEFIWVVGNKAQDENGVDNLPAGFEARTQGRGLVMRGWAPQVQILEHEAVGGFLTHCGWNSLLEGVVAGVPMVTWPLSVEQFSNEKLVTEILGMGIPVGAEEWALRNDERAAVKSDKIERAVVQLMVGEEGERMRNRARELGDMAKTAVQKGGSSDIDFNSLIQEIRSFRS